MAAFTRPLARPLFRRFLLGQAASRTGDFVFYVALPWHVVIEGGGESEIGLVLAVLLTAHLALVLFGGALVDRVSRKRVIVLSDVFQAIAVGAAALLAFQGDLSLALLLPFAVAWGAAQAAAFPAIGAFLPDIVPPEELQAANSLHQSVSLGAAVFGSLVAGFLVAAFGVWSAFAFDAVTFAVSAALLATVPSPPARATRERGRSLFAEIREGWAFVASVPWLWMGIAIFSVFNAAEASPRNVVLPTLVGVYLGGGAVALGLVKATFHTGWLAGSLLPGLVGPIRRPGVVSYLIAGMTGLLFISVSQATAVWQVALAFFVQGIGFGIVGVIWSTSVGTFVEERLRGRVISIDALGSTGLMPLSTALAGAAAAAYGPSWLFFVGGLIVLACGACGLASRRARSFGPAPSGAASP